MQSRSHQVMGSIFTKTKKKLAKIVFPEGHHPKIQQAAQILREEGICEPVLLGPVDVIKESIAQQRLEELDGITRPEEAAPDQAVVLEALPPPRPDLRSSHASTLASTSRPVNASGPGHGAA